MMPSSSTFSAVRRERRAGGGDVDDQLGGAGGRRAFGRAEALDDAVVDDAVLREKLARQVHVLGRDAHLAVVRRAERGRDIVEVRHGAHVDPGLRHRDHDVGLAEAELVDQHDARSRRPEYVSRIWSSPVTPKCTAPAPSCVVMSEAER